MKGITSASPPSTPGASLRKIYRVHIRYIYGDILGRYYSRFFGRMVKFGLPFLFIRPSGQKFGCSVLYLFGRMYKSE